MEFRRVLFRSNAELSPSITKTTRCALGREEFLLYLGAAVAAGDFSRLSIMTKCRASSDVQLESRFPQDGVEEARSIQQAMLPVEPLRSSVLEVTCKFRPAAE